MPRLFVQIKLYILRNYVIFIWPHGVTVSTLDSESSDRGSNPSEAFTHESPALVVLQVPLYTGLRTTLQNLSVLPACSFQNLRPL